MVHTGKRIVPVALGIAMLGVVIAAALTPNLGTVSAQTDSDYSHPTTSSTGLSTYAWLGIAAVIIIAAILLALLLMGRRRRRQPPATGEPTPAAAAIAPPPGAGGPPPPSAPPTAPPAAAPAYLETPEDVGQAPPVVPSTAPAAAGGAAAGAAGPPAEGEPDIDSLMAELDKISGEILKRAPKKGTETKTDTSQSDETNR